MPVSVTVPSDGITFEVMAIDNNFTLEEKRVTLRFEHRFGLRFLERVNDVGEYFRTTTTVWIFINDSK